MGMRRYEIECDMCGEMSHIFHAGDDRNQPEFCPMCGTDAYPIFIDEEEDSDG